MFWLLKLVVSGIRHFCSKMSWFGFRGLECLPCYMRGCNSNSLPNEEARGEYVRFDFLMEKTLTKLIALDLTVRQQEQNGGLPCVPWAGNMCKDEPVKSLVQPRWATTQKRNTATWIHALWIAALERQNRRFAKANKDAILNWNWMRLMSLWSIVSHVLPFALCEVGTMGRMFYNLWPWAALSHTSGEQSCDTATSSGLLNDMLCCCDSIFAAKSRWSLLNCTGDSLGLWERFLGLQAKSQCQEHCKRLQKPKWHNFLKVPKTFDFNVKNLLISPQSSNLNSTTSLHPSFRDLRPCEEAMVESGSCGSNETAPGCRHLREFSECNWFFIIIVIIIYIYIIYIYIFKCVFKDKGCFKRNLLEGWRGNVSLRSSAEHHSLHNHQLGLWLS